jgi:hypothetical protein
MSACNKERVWIRRATRGRCNGRRRRGTAEPVSFSRPNRSGGSPTLPIPAKRPLPACVRTWAEGKGRFCADSWLVLRTFTTARLPI